jgi:hypothetical protein
MAGKKKNEDAELREGKKGKGDPEGERERENRFSNP